MIFNLEKEKKEAKEKIEKSSNLKELDIVFREYLGPKGKLKSLSSSLKKISLNKRKALGKKINEFKEYFLKILEEKKKRFLSEKENILEKEWIDITIPPPKLERGSLHPLTIIKRKVEEIFQLMGFSIVEGPEIETEWYNFDALNIPKEHPARDLWDTFYLKGKNNLLRTHTSSVQIRFMEKNTPPFRIISVGRVFRREATDAGHEINFHQVEGLVVDRKVSIANFKWVVEEFFNRLFKKNIQKRLRPSYFPFTEPSFEVDIHCPWCKKNEDCERCKGKKWIEVMGAGMVHPNVLRAVNFNEKEWSGFAFGLGLERLAMIFFGIDDIRLFYSGDLRFLNQF
jgi:phenylalanyl-tRNA synthetase alpha chain